MGNPNNNYSGDHLPAGCKLAAEIELGEYNDFEENGSSFSGSDLLIAMGAGIISGVLGAWYVRRNDKRLYC